MSSVSATQPPAPGIKVGALDLGDMARVLTAFLGQPIGRTLASRAARGGGPAPAYRFDEESGMVYILD